MTFQVPILKKEEGYQFLWRVFLLGLNLNPHPPTHTSKQMANSLLCGGKHSKGELTAVHLFMHPLYANRHSLTPPPPKPNSDIKFSP